MIHLIADGHLFIHVTDIIELLLADTDLGMGHTSDHGDHVFMGLPWNIYIY